MAIIRRLFVLCAYSDFAFSYYFSPLRKMMKDERYGEYYESSGFRVPEIYQTGTTQTD